jgi:hypothetical protein
MNSSILDPLVFEPELGGQILCVGGPQHGRIIHLPPMKPGQMSVVLPRLAPGGYCHPTYFLDQMKILGECQPIWMLIAESHYQLSETVNQMEQP